MAGADDVPTLRGAHASGSRSDARRLAADATFGDLVAAVAALDGTDDESSEAGCLLRTGRDGSPHRLEADVAVAVHPLPPVPADLDAHLEGPVAILTRWGLAGDPGTARLALVSLTASRPTRGGLLVAVTDEGVHARPVGTPTGTGPRFSRLEVPTAAARLREALGAEGTSHGVLFVTAERNVPLTRLIALFEALGPVAHATSFAVALAPGTRLPSASPAAMPAADTHCPDGLPEPGPEEPEGELPALALGGALSPLREAAVECLRNAGPEGGHGGRVLLAMRIDASGRVAHACVMRDEIGDPILAACIVRAARTQQLPAPRPAGFVDVALPLRLQPIEPAPTRPLCAGSARTVPFAPLPG
ncbi:MAG: hypothetical protein NZ898_05200 [Myxococcota bacterium]|nr:hypothetical protein [Myxococcota bacterium]